jgi:hypothetical protein
VRRHKPTADPLPHQRADLVDWWLTRGRREASQRANAASAIALDDPPPALPDGPTAGGSDDGESATRPAPAAPAVNGDHRAHPA